MGVSVGSRVGWCMWCARKGGAGLLSWMRPPGRGGHWANREDYRGGCGLSGQHGTDKVGTITVTSSQK